MDLLARLHGLACADGDCSACRGRCEHEAGVYLNETWDRCPVADINDDVQLTAARALRSQANISPLSDFPNAYTPGVVGIMTALAVAEQEYREETRHG